MRARPLLVVGLLLAAAPACKPAAPPPAERPRLVTVAPVVQGDAVERLELLGEVEGELEVKVFAQLAERITRLHVREGDRVKAGDPIATLHADLQAAGVLQARGAHEAAVANRDRLRDEVARGKKLAAGDGMSPAQLQALEASLRAAEAQVEQLAGAASAAAEQRKRTVIRAPNAGVVGLIGYDEGAMANPAVPVATVAKVDRLKVILRAAEPEWVKIETGMAAEVGAPALPGVRLAGKVLRRSPMLDRATRSGTVELLVDNPEGLLAPGMVARAEIELSRRSGAILVPGAAVLLTPTTDADGSAVTFVLAADGTARKRMVTLGRRYGDEIEVVEGLAAGERLVVRGQHLLRDGSPVKVEGEPDAPPPAGEGAAPPSAEDAAEVAR